jgi:hypothetical protein
MFLVQIGHARLDGVIEPPGAKLGLASRGLGTKRRISTKTRGLRVIAAASMPAIHDLARLGTSGQGRRP